MDDHDIGDTITPYVDFKNAAGAAAAPTTVVLTVLKPNGTTSTPAVTTPSLGRYEATVAIDQSGTWTYRWVGTGAVAAAEEGSFYVRRSLVLA